MKCKQQVCISAQNINEEKTTNRYEVPTSNKSIAILKFVLYI